MWNGLRLPCLQQTSPTKLMSANESTTQSSSQEEEEEEPKVRIEKEDQWLRRKIKALMNIRSLMSLSRHRRSFCAPKGRRCFLSIGSKSWSLQLIFKSVIPSDIWSAWVVHPNAIIYSYGQLGQTVLGGHTYATVWYF